MAKIGGPPVETIVNDDDDERTSVAVTGHGKLTAAFTSSTAFSIFEAAETLLLTAVMGGMGGTAETGVTEILDGKWYGGDG